MHNTCLLTLFIISFFLLSALAPLRLTTSVLANSKTVTSVNRRKSSYQTSQRTSLQVLKSLAILSRPKITNTGHNGDSAKTTKGLKKTGSNRKTALFNLNNSRSYIQDEADPDSYQEYNELSSQYSRLNSGEKSDLKNVGQACEKCQKVTWHFLLNKTAHPEKPRPEATFRFRAPRFLSDVKSKLEAQRNKAARWRVSTKEARELFDKYYLCMQERVKELQAEEFPIKAFMTVEGDRLALPCGVCYRPDRDRKSQEARWQILLHESSSIQELAPSNKVKVTKGNTLILKDISVADTGQYFCLDQDDYVAIYQVDVFLRDRRRHLKFPQSKARAEKVLLKHNLRVLTVWAPWTECNTCNWPGHKYRVGQCMVKKLYADLPIFPRDYPLMMLYPDGVPCHSTALPRHLRRLPDIRRRHSETLVGSCMEACPTEPPLRTVTDDSGKVVEVLELGFYSMKNKPTLPPLIKYKVLYEPEKSHLVLNCPIQEEETSLIRWLRGRRQVDPISIRRQTQGRVFVDSLSRLHLKPLLLTDTAVYNCWVKARHVAAIKLIVVDEGHQHIKIYISYAGLTAAVLGSVMVILCICCKKSDKNAA